MNKIALICEDNLTTASCIKIMLEKFNYNADIAQNVKEAFELLNKRKYDLLTLDILLPDANGLDLLKEIQSIELAKDLPVIVISSTKKENADLNFENNIVYWLEKSFDVNALGIVIDNILKQKNKDKIEIFYVENDEDLLNLIDISLNDFANVTLTNNLLDAKEILNRNKFDIIILDYVFPEGTCDKLISTIKSGINSEASLVLFSAYECNKTFSEYFDEIIVKANISFDEFKECIKKFIVFKDKVV